MGERIPVTLGSIETLAFKPFAPGKMALVCEGGGQRGIFTAGVLDEFLRHKFNPFDLLIGSSAGAQNLSSYLCDQYGYARRFITRYSTKSEFFNPIRFLRGGHLVDLDWLLGDAVADFPLDVWTGYKKIVSGTEFLMCACRSDNFKAHYFAPSPHTWMPIMKASSAIPMFFRDGVQLDGITYHDGGVSDAVPVEEAYRRGAKTIVVVRTVPSAQYNTTRWLKSIKKWVPEHNFQQMLKMYQQHEITYARTQAFIDNPPDDVHVFEIYPPTPLASSALGSSLAALQQDYHLGRRCGRYFMATQDRWMKGKR